MNGILAYLLYCFSPLLLLLVLYLTLFLPTILVFSWPEFYKGFLVLGMAESNDQMNWHWKFEFKLSSEDCLKLLLCISRFYCVFLFLLSFDHQVVGLNPKNKGCFPRLTWSGTKWWFGFIIWCDLKLQNAKV